MKTQVIPVASSEVESEVVEEVKKRVMRITLHSTVLLVLAVTLNITLPRALVTFLAIPAEGFSLSTAFLLVLVVVMAFQTLRIILDLVRLIDVLSEVLVKHLPGLKTERKVSVIKAFKEVIIVILLIIVLTLLAPFALMMPELEPWLSVGVSMTAIIISIILLYDAGKTLYAMLQSGIDLLIERIIRQRECKRAPC